MADVTGSCERSWLTVIILVVPFTLSHAAAAIPFRRTLLVPSAVIAGCFAPDFEYFLRFAPRGGYGHTLSGMFLLDLPLAFIGLWLFYNYAREPLVESMPAGVQQRLAPGPGSLSIQSFSRFTLVAFSILIGSATHILWDWFTHPRYWLYEHWEFLRRTATVPILGQQQYCHILQYISSVVGILLILGWSVRWYRSSSPGNADLDRRGIFVTRCVLAGGLVIAIVAGFVRAVATGMPHGIHGSQRFTTESVVTAITVFCLEVIVYGFFRSRRSRSG